MTGSHLKAAAALAVLGALCARPCFAQVSDDDRGKFAPLPRLFEALDAKPGARIADVGSGDGFYTLQLARAVAPGGRVTATDIDPEALGKLKKHIETEKLDNVDVVLGRTDDPLLEPDTFDAVLIRNAYHEMTEHESILRHVREALKLGGRLVVAEKIRERSRRLSRKEQVAAHEIVSDIVVSELLAAGFEIRRRDESFDPLTETENPGGYWLIVAVKPRAIPTDQFNPFSADMRRE